MNYRALLQIAILTILILSLSKDADISCAPGTTPSAAPSSSTTPGSRSMRIEPDQVRRELNDILSRPEYNRSQQEPGLIQKALEAIGEAIGRAIQWVIHTLARGIGRGVQSILSAILAWAVVLGFLALLALLVSRLVGLGRGAPGTHGPEIATYELPSAESLIAQASRLAASGDYRGAFRLAYLASIAHLDEVKALRFERSRTNWEYLCELADRGHDQPRRELLTLTSDFDRKFYGGERCESTDYEYARAAYQRILQVSTA